MKAIVSAWFFLLAMATFGLAQRADGVPTPVLLVTGNADILAAPDQATVRLGIVRQATVAQAAQEQANTVAQEILNAIARVGVEPQQIQTSRLILSPQYAPRNPDSREAPRIVGYTASNAVSVRLTDLALVGPVIDAGLKSGANQLEGVQFGLRNDLPSREEALKQAVTEARSKAQVMAEALNVKLGDVLEVSEGGVSVVPRGDFMALSGRAEMAGATPTPVSTGQIEVHANVTIRYGISPKQ